MIPGALAAFICGGLIPDARWRKAFPQAVIFGGIGFLFGGNLSYGAIVNAVIAAKDLTQMIPQFVQIFFIGAIWGSLGMTFLGFGIAELEMQFRDLAVL